MTRKFSALSSANQKPVSVMRRRVWYFFLASWCIFPSLFVPGYELLASASRDRLIQIFDVKNDYNCLQTLDDHSSSITALRFAALNGARQFGLISCGVDKAVILRTIQYSADSDPKFILNDQISSKGGGNFCSYTFFYSENFFQKFKIFQNNFSFFPQ